MFGRKRSDEPEEQPAEEQEEGAEPVSEQPPLPPPDTANTALLRAYFQSSGHSEEEIQALIGTQDQPSGAEPIGEQETMSFSQPISESPDESVGSFSAGISDRMGDGQPAGAEPLVPDGETAASGAEPLTPEPEPEQSYSNRQKVG